ncbi:MAG: DUF2071 domain-containing protein [Rhodothermaceae bacterium]|nr:DUF2071 domain-containing protein [Rhodothermaceae bacterium]
MPRPFLTARWEHLVFLNYACPRALLDPLVPEGTSLDLWNGEALVSLVGFRFADTKVRGLPIPGHRTFEEVNLRFYVRRTAPDGTERPAVVFIRELVPRRAIAFVARTLYNEPYRAVPMAHDVALDRERGGFAEYTWRAEGEPFAMRADVEGPAGRLEPGTEAAFITEHYWGYTRQRDGGTLEYQVEHPPWEIWTAHEARFTGPAAALYGPAFGEVLAAAPQSAFVAWGSEVAVYPGQRLA